MMHRHPLNRLAVTLALLAFASGCALSGGGKINGTVADPPDIPGLGSHAVDNVTVSDNPLVSGPDELPSFEMFNYKDIDALGNDTAYHRLLKKAVDYAIEENILRKPMGAGRSADALLAQKAQQETQGSSPASATGTPASQTPAPAAEASADTQSAMPILFKPDEPVTYGDFYRWYERFRDALRQEKNAADQGAATSAPAATAAPKTAPQKPDQKTAAQNKPAPAAAMTPKASTVKADGVDVATTPAAAMTPAPADQSAPAAPAPPDLGPFKPSMTIGDQTLTPKTVLTRQTLCALFTIIDADLKGETGTASLDAMTPEEWQALKPEGATGGQTLADFHDYAAIDAALKKYVGEAYKDTMLQTVFGLTPETLSEDAGLGPEKTVSRGQALVMIYWAMKGR